MLDFLREHAPWRQLVAQGNVDPREVTPGVWTPLTPHLAVRPLLVPHRDEWSDTVGYVVRGALRQLLYLPDIDSWEAWARPPYSQDVRQVVAGVDAALVDASFYAEGELPGRDMRAIGHPLVVDTVEALAHEARKVTLIHLNHTKPPHRLYGLHRHHPPSGPVYKIIPPSPSGTTPYVSRQRGPP